MQDTMQKDMSQPMERDMTRPMQDTMQKDMSQPMERDMTRPMADTMERDMEDTMDKELEKNLQDSISKNMNLDSNEDFTDVMVGGGYIKTNYLKFDNLGKDNIFINQSMVDNFNKRLVKKSENRIIYDTGEKKIKGYTNNDYFKLY